MKTSGKDYELFKKECRKWIKVFGLLNWKVYFDHLSKSDCLAGCNIDTTNRVATLYLNKDWGKDEISNKAIKSSAYHEVMELFLGPLRCLAASRFINEDEIDEQIHVVIGTLENVAYPRLK